MITLLLAMLASYPSPWTARDTAAMHAAVAYLLPRPYRTIWQGLVIGAEIGAITHNARKMGGFRVAF